MFQTARKVKLPITAAFHASHLGHPDVEGILGPLFDGNDYPVREDVIMISTSSGQQLVAQTLSEILRQVVLDTLQETLRWSKVAQHLVSELADQGVQIKSAGPVRAADSLLRELRNSKVNVLESTEMQPTQQEDLSTSSNDIAIVGFASRMPESETLEEIWKILEDGRDVHKKVNVKNLTYGVENL